MFTDPAADSRAALPPRFDPVRIIRAKTAPDGGPLFVLNPAGMISVIARLEPKNNRAEYECVVVGPSGPLDAYIGLGMTDVLLNAFLQFLQFGALPFPKNYRREDCQLAVHKEPDQKLVNIDLPDGETFPVVEVFRLGLNSFRLGIMDREIPCTFTNPVFALVTAMFLLKQRQILL